jgi:HEAT repeat protein
MRRFRKPGSLQFVEEIQRRTLALLRSLKSHWVLTAVVCGLISIAVAGAWVGIDSSVRLHPEGPFRETLNPRVDGPVTPSAAGHLSVAELAAMEVIGGVRTPEKGKAPNPLLRPEGGAGVSPREQELLARLETGSDAEALEAIRALAALGGDANRLRLANIMMDEDWSDALRTEAARLLIETGNTKEALLSVRALAAIGGDTNTDTLTTMMKDPSLSQQLRLEAALALGIVATPRAGDALIQAFTIFPDPDIHEQLLGALGHFPFSQIEATVRQFVDNPNTPSELRVAAVDSLSNSSPEALPFLKAKAASDRDPEVRAMSAWAISTFAENGTMGPELARMATAEPEADVRCRLYEALLVQDDNPAEKLLPLIRSETDIDARVAGFNAIGDAVNRGDSISLATMFDTQIIPELTKIALSRESLNIRMRSVFALRRADTAAAQQALLVISETSTPQIAGAARNGLKPAK